MNLLEVLTQDDRDKIAKYVSYYGGANGGFVGVDAWLKNWAESNQKLYRLLGNNISISIPYEYEKNKTILIDEMESLLNTRYIQKVRQLYSDLIWALYDAVGLACLPTADRANLLTEVLDGVTLANNEINFSLRCKIKGKTLQLQEGMKPIKALNKILSWARSIMPEGVSQELVNGVEILRQKHSTILTDKKVKAELVLSIHPLDFLTMSDNNNGWTSCMSWIDAGCYHAGTVEMMNSNVVLCAFLKSDYSFEYVVDSFEEGEEWNQWNSKKWRQLFYINKDIILSGKSYPYANQDFSYFILDKLKELAEKNIGWKYNYGIEQYKDMLGVNSILGMDRSRREQILNKKKTIIINTKAMYNDMLNDSKTKYWCYRNKPKKGYILQASGKLNCVKCNSIINSEENYFASEYNDRYEGENTVCDSCLEDITCYCCNGNRPVYGKIPMYRIEDSKDNIYKLCGMHLGLHLSQCPFCNEPMNVLDYWKQFFISNNVNSTFKENKITSITELKYRNEKELYEKLWEAYNQGNFVAIKICNNCLNSKNLTWRIESTRSCDAKKFFFASSVKVVNENVILSEEEFYKAINKRTIPLTKEQLNMPTIKLNNEFIVYC